MAALRMAARLVSLSGSFFRSSLNSAAANQLTSLSRRSFTTSGVSENIFKGLYGLQSITRLKGFQNNLQVIPATQKILNIQQTTYSTLQNQIKPTRLTSPQIGSFASGVRHLPTLNQVRRQKPRTKNVQAKPYVPRSERILLGPQRKGVCIKVFIRKPKKPNSAQRKCALLKLSNGKTISAYIPHEKGQLQEHGVVLFEGGRVQDCPGIRFKIVRGKLDMN